MTSSKTRRISIIPNNTSSNVGNSRSPIAMNNNAKLKLKNVLATIRVAKSFLGFSINFTIVFPRLVLDSNSPWMSEDDREKNAASAPETSAVDINKTMSTEKFKIVTVFTTRNNGKKLEGSGSNVSYFSCT